ncbi:hypothetical protein Daus18300_012656 [Diaporthe australafricana]|uniref:Heterokaryon incompatibility domain-containing protein n=1 Tax=Diaporthe australafricana TaxID=127596 RepID=A0ABR3W236_9PEZI
MRWRVPLKHRPYAVEEAASSGCPFFVWIWDQLNKSDTPPEQMKRTSINLELEAVKLKESPAVEADKDRLPLPSLGVSGRNNQVYDITACTVKVETDSYAWDAAKFDVMSDWMGNLSDWKQNVKVVRAGTVDYTDPEPYAALSYCWGQDQDLKTTLANKLDMEANVPLSRLPKTIKDAIYLTRKLHIKLLWVDSLCLVQDDEQEMATEVARMHHYYGNSCITFSAATATSCSEGFLHDEPKPHASEDDTLGPFYFPVDLEVPDETSLPQMFSRLKIPSWMVKPACLKLVIRRIPEEAIDSRAWTQQEGLLSRRLVSFGSRVIRWSCQTESHGMHSQSHMRDALRAFHSGVDDGYQRSKMWEVLKLWCTLIENYTARALSNEQDKLPAISGIASILCQSQINSTSSLLDDDRLTAGSFSPSFETGDLGHCISEASAGQGSPHRTRLVEASEGIDRGHYAAGLIDVPIPVGEWPIELHRDWRRTGFASTLLTLQLLWTPRSTTNSKRGGALYNVAPSWSWASHEGGVDMRITLIEKVRMDAVHVTYSKLRSKILMVRTEPTSSGAPYGALTGGSLTIEGPIFSPGTEQFENALLVFDSEGRDAINDDLNSRICLQIMPKLRGLQAKDLVQLTTVTVGGS